MLPRSAGPISFPFRHIEPDFAAAPVVFTIPVKGSPAMQPSDALKRLRKFSGQNHSMIMVWQHAPRMDFFAVSFQSFQQPSGKISQPLRIQADDGMLFIASSRQQITSVLAGLMSWTVPGSVVKTTEFKQLFTLFLVKFSPEIHWLEFKLQLVFRWSSNFSLFHSHPTRNA